MKSLVHLIISILILTSCNNNKVAETEKDSLNKFDKAEIQSEILKNEYESRNDSNRDTRLRYNDFTVIFQNFIGYTKYDSESENYYIEFNDNDKIKRAILNTKERNNKNYIPELIVIADTVRLSESFIEDKYHNGIIDNTIIKIKPKNKKDNFEVSFCYLSTLINFTDLGNGNYGYNTNNYKKEKTLFYNLKESANFNFKISSSAEDINFDMLSYNKDGVSIPLKRNSNDKINYSQYLFELDFNRIKEKYNLKDTIVDLNKEYHGIARLTNQQNDLFHYLYDSYLFRIKRYSEGKLIETKYILVYLWNGIA